MTRVQAPPHTRPGPRRLDFHVSRHFLARLSCQHHAFFAPFFITILPLLIRAIFVVELPFFHCSQTVYLLICTSTCNIWIVIEAAGVYAQGKLHITSSSR
ncbi:hypothetical protein C8R44DRAFT_411487 [Mycena epipterygia]|nr:hypothetical protein C8R44DRAFT_411487 [Mycena epipterygia]